MSLGGLGGVALVDSLTFAFAVLATVLVKAKFDIPSAPVGSNIFRQAVEGVALTLRHQVLRPALVLTAAVAAFAVPVGSLIVPLLARENDWGAGAAGFILASQSVGTLAVALLVAHRGAAGRPGLAAGLSVIPVTIGVGMLEWSDSPTQAIVAAAIFGTGLGLFVSHIGPLMLAASPGSYLGRVQSLITLVQSVSLIVTLNLLGRLADRTSVDTTALTCSFLLAAAGLVALLSASLRRARLAAGKA